MEVPTEMISLALLAQVLVAVPATTEPPQLGVPPDPARLSLVVADTVSETDPQPLCDRPDCLSLFLGRYSNAMVLAGMPVEPQFAARIAMGSPWISRYRLAFIVEQREQKEWLVRAVAGFGDGTHEACFERRDTDSLNWDPAGPKIVKRGRVLCVQE